MSSGRDQGLRGRSGAGAPSGHQPTASAASASSQSGTPNAKRTGRSVYEKPRPARLILAEALGISIDEAKDALVALIKGGYGIAPNLPTNGMLAAYIEATPPAKGHEQIITAIGKARVRWQAMLAHGTEMALSIKYLPASAIEARSDATAQTGAAEGESATAESRDAHPHPGQSS